MITVVVALAIMTKFGNIPPMSTLPENFASQTPGLVAALTYDGLCTFEFGIAVEVFGLARPEFEFPWYKFKVVASEHRRVSAMGGITVEADAGLEAASLESCWPWRQRLVWRHP